MSVDHKLHWSFWLICILGLIWNAMGFMNFFMQLSPEGITQMPASHQAIAKARPDWVSASFGISVIAGALGCLAMLFKKRIALLLLSLSFIATVVTIA
ncbi:MAG: hypothetical protein AB8B49_02630, partial [Nitratireductor sp.]